MTELSTEVLSSVPKCKKAVACLLKGIRSALFRHEHSAVGHEFLINESTIPINKASLNRNPHKARLHIGQLMKML